MKQYTKELLELLNNQGGNLYDYICNNYYLMEADKLADLAKESACLLYVYAEREHGDKGTKKAHTELLEQIKEYRPELLEIEEESESADNE